MNGLLDQTRLVTIEAAGEKVWSKTKVYWQQGDNQPTGRDNPPGAIVGGIVGGIAGGLAGSKAGEAAVCAAQGRN